jgi:hypothetical protein
MKATMMQLLNWLKQHRAAIVRDAVGLAGVAAIVVGLYQAYAPIAWMFGGAVAVAWSFAAEATALFSTRQRNRRG